MKRILTLALAALMILTLAACGSEPVVKVIDIELTQEEYAFGVDKDQPELLTKVNEFIAKIQKDGTFDEICNKYFGDGTPHSRNLRSPRRIQGSARCCYQRGIRAV